jgi:tRNA nucleotidyltransferase/poly(A) polymerase
MWRDALTRLFPALASLDPDSYVVGGAVRDLHLGIEPADADVACLDPLANAKKLGGRLVRLGDQEHLTAYRVVLPDHVYDFAALLDGSIDADLARRDFTVNAMAVDLDRDELLDPHGGRDDIARRLVRMVRAENFDDDPLRTLKAIRMAVKYDFEIEAETLEAIRARAHRITEVASERVTYELTAIFSSNRLRKAVRLFVDTGLAEPLNVRPRRLFADETSVNGAFSLLFEAPRPREAQALQRLVEHHDRVALYDAGEELARQLPAVLRALGRDDELDMPDFSIRALLRGEELGVPPGPELGRIKRALLEAQIRGEVTTREEAERFVRALTGSA